MHGLLAVPLVPPWLALAIIFSPASCLIARQTGPESAPAAERLDTITRHEIIAIARRYAEHKWSASADNVFHGLDNNKNPVDTPDSSYRKGGFLVGKQNMGIPYKWGGFSSIEEFDDGIAKGKFAGHLPRKGSSPASPQAVGVDCSGLVSRCWDLPRKHSTRSLVNICYPLKSFGELQLGDIINSFDGHVVIFESFVDDEKTKVAVYEAGRTRVERNIYPVSRLTKNGLKPLRYKPLDDRWTPQSLAAASFTASTNASTGHFRPGSNRTSPLSEVDVSWHMQQHDWARYQVGVGERSLRSVVRVDSEGTVIRDRYSKAGKVQLNERRLAANALFVQLLIHFAGFDQDFGDLKIVESEVESGVFLWEKCQFDARRFKLEVNTTLLIRGTTYPVQIRMQAVISSEVPLAGIIKCRYETTVGSGGKILGKSVKQIDLIEFFKG